MRFTIAAGSHTQVIDSDKGEHCVMLFDGRVEQYHSFALAKKLAMPHGSPIRTRTYFPIAELQRLATDTPDLSPNGADGEDFCSERVGVVCQMCGKTATEFEYSIGESNCCHAGTVPEEQYERDREDSAVYFDCEPE